MSRKFGVELEVAGGNHGMHEVAAMLNAAGVACVVEGYNHTARKHWKIVSDGSLSGGRNMMELVSPPIKGRKGLAEVEKVAETLQSRGITVNASCGLHVHVDAHGLDANHLKNVAKLIVVHEDHMKSILPQTRRVTRWAKWPSDLRIGNTVADRCARIDAMTTVSQLRNLWGNDRYHAINFESLSRHTTVEFRSHSGTCDPKKIIAWIMLCVGIVRNADTDEVLGEYRLSGKNRRKRSFRTLLRYAGKAHRAYFFERRAQFEANSAAV